MSTPESARSWRLRACFEGLFAPNYLVGRSRRTLSAYREALDHWERLSGDLPAAAIDQQTLLAFRAALADPRNFVRPVLQRMLFEVREPAERHGLSPVTVNKHVATILRILSKLGPERTGGRDALGILDRAPWIKPLRTMKRKPRPVADDLLDTLYRACETAGYPRIAGVAPRFWWRALVVTALCSGYRRGALMALRWTWISLLPDIAEIRLPAEEDKCREARVKPISRLVVLHLTRIRTPADLVFPFPHSSRTFYREWHRIQDVAGIERHIKVHDLKRACSSRYAAIASPWVVQEIGDWSNLETSRSYVNASDEARLAVNRLRLPAVFSADFPELRG